jgi:hypothetical protein
MERGNRHIEEEDQDGDVPEKDYYVSTYNSKPLPLRTVLWNCNGSGSSFGKVTVPAPV